MSDNLNKDTIPNDYELIQRFFEWELSDEERQAFEQRMESDTTFLQRIESYQAIDEQIELQFNQNETAKQQKIKKDWKNTKHEPTKVRPLASRKRWLRMTGIAASFLLLIALAWWLLPSNTTTSPQILASAYYQKTGHQSVSTFRSSAEQNPTDKTLEKASTAFKAKQYTQALDMLQAIPSIYPLYHQVVLLRGQCYFGLENWIEAVQQFQAVIDAPEGGRKDLALWYQALTYLQQEEVEKAKQNLENIVAERYPIAKEAELLLKEIK